MAIGEPLLAADATGLPTMTIMANGQDVTLEAPVFSLNVVRAANRISRCQLVLRDGNAAEQDFALSGTDHFIPGSEIVINMGYDSLEEQVFSGIVIRHSVEFRGLNSSVLVVECQDAAVKMTIGRKNAYFYEKTDQTIMEDIIKSYGLTAEVDSTDEEHAEMVQYYATDWDFLMARAEANGMLVFTEDGTVKVLKPAFTGSSVGALEHGTNLFDFHATMDSRWQYPSSKSFAWDYSGQEVLEKEGKVSSFTEAGDLSGDDLSGDMELEHLQLQHPGKRSDGELQSWADSTMMRSRLSKICGSGRVRGMPTIFPGQVVTLSGVGTRFNGDVYVTGTKQEFSTHDYKTTVEFGLSPKWHSTKYEDIVDPEASGLLPGIHGLQTGVVTNIHEDPDGEYRVQVTLPMISTEEDGVWARVATLDAGDSRGSFFRPEVGDEVAVGFVNGDPRDPIILGMLHSSALPSPLEPEEENNEKGFVTRSGIQLLFNDDTVTVTIETPNGNTIVLDEDSGSILMEDENGNKIEMTSDGITIESAKDLILKASGDVSVEGTNVDIAAQSQFTAEGTGGAEVSTSATAVLKGSIVQIN